ncbi:MAG: DUF86 domain-containing protein [Coprothermobacterota bacterium]|nr:DUF86 domain-containing protein [Coprothermobacterota bacterium]
MARASGRRAVTPSKIRASIVLERAERITELLRGIDALPLGSYLQFQGDPRNPAAAESFLRRALEALLDLGQHILAKAFGLGPLEYKEVALTLARQKVLGTVQSALLVELAGYRNRLVHFYDEVSARELYDICKSQLQDIRNLLRALLDWIHQHPDLVDGVL